MHVRELCRLFVTQLQWSGELINGIPQDPHPSRHRESRVANAHYNKPCYIQLHVLREAEG